VTEKIKLRYVIYGTLSLLFYICAVIGYASWSNHDRMNSLQHEIDQRMIVVARSLKYMLEPDFHDRSLDEKSISFEEEMKNRKALSDFAKQTEFKWIYTLVEKDGKYYFSAPTVSEEEAKERKSWYFYPYADIPPEFVEAYRTGKTVFVDYSDQWGNFRSVAIPEVSPGGRRYIACADYEISHLNALKRKNLSQSVLTAVFFFLCSIPFIIIFRSFFEATTIKLKAMNQELTTHRDHLENLVKARTIEIEAANERLKEELRERERIEQDLRQEKRKLEQALVQVKTLNGLLPICSSCKKIRDDKGYWNQIESYIRAHSEAEFSHGICPECLERLYPDY
jgi:hypothetical protein